MPSWSTWQETDGRTAWQFSQSWLSELTLCPERARVDAHRCTDAAALGTAMHAGFEQALLEVLAEEEASYHASLGTAVDMWQQLALEPDFEWVQMKSVGRGEIFLANAMNTFFDHVLPDMQPVVLEHKFEHVEIYSDAEKIIYLEGTIDCIDAQLGIIDWKSAGQEYKPWEKSRWAVQPSAYTYAAVEQNLIYRDEGEPPEQAWDFMDTMSAEPGRPPAPVPFTYFVFLKPHASLQRVTVLRDEGDWAWLSLRCRNAVSLIESDLEHWPVNDSHALCSPKWCPIWKDCKGAFVEEDWPRRAVAW